MDLSNFLGGLFIPAAFGAEIPSTALLTADDITFDPVGFVRGRRGRALYGSVPNTPISIWRHYPKTGSPATLVASDSGSAVRIYHDTISNGVFALPSGSPSTGTGKRFFFTNWASKDRSFFANGEGLWSYNGVVTAVTQTGVQMTGPYCVVHAARLFGTVMSEINFSVYATDIDNETTVGSGNHLNVSDVQGGSVTGLFSMPDRLVILKSTSVFVMLGDIRYSVILTNLHDTGCIAPASAVKTEWGIIFVGRSGVFMTDGQNPHVLELSAPIRTLWIAPGVNNTYPNAVAAWYPRRNQYHLKLNPADPYIYVLTRLEPLSGKGTVWAWSRYTNTPLTCGIAWDSELDNGDLYVGQAGGNLYRLDNGTTDAGTAFAPTIQTAQLRLSEHLQVGRVHYVYINYQGTQASTVGLRYNNGAANDVTISMGQSQSLGLQRTRQKINDQTKSGHFVSAVVTLPTDADKAELYSIRVDPRVSSRRLFR